MAVYRLQLAYVYMLRGLIVSCEISINRCNSYMLYVARR